MLHFSFLHGSQIINTLVWPVIIVLHLPEFKLALSVLGVYKPDFVKNIFIVGPIAALDESIFPRLALGNQGMDSSLCFNCFSKGSFVAGMIGIFHGKIHSIVCESYKKGGRFSNAL
jgi:hypothetical protein